jgi:FAD/FMN-containing dehydrogenase
MNGMSRDSSPLLDRIMAIVGPRGILTGEDVSARSCDPFRHVPPGSPAIIRPASSEELSQILSLCHDAGQPIVTHGGRTGVAGGAVAGPDDLVMSLERMTKIIEIDPVTQTAVVEAGVTIEAVQNAVAEHGLLYPIDLGSKGSATVGGTIATNAGGNRVLRWGMTRPNILGLEAVLADGTIVNLMNRFLKNNTGYDLKQLFIGSEGTLGIVTRAVLRLVPLPTTQKLAFIAVPDYPSVLKLLTRARSMQQLSAFEVMWRDYYAVIAAHDPHRCPLATDQKYYVLAETMGMDEAADEQAMQGFLEQAFEDGLIADAVTASSLKQVQDLWRIREGSELLVKEMGPFISFDISVDIRRAEEFVGTVYQRLDTQFGFFKAISFGHLGDSNIHIGVHVGPDTIAREAEIDAVVYGEVKQFGGALTAEHGIGTSKRDYLPSHITPQALETMARVRNALDADRILNRKMVF